jgi:hypothetical protein
VPVANATAAAKILCLDTQPCTFSYAEAGKIIAFGDGGTGRGLMCSGIHGKDAN